jgi:hypothetical protein
MILVMSLDVLLQGQAALDHVGMPASHGKAFEQIALAENCVISSRELGETGKQLVEEGYDSKGFRIKTKSCDFGPMAGFVVEDPRFSKKGLAFAATQAKYTTHALTDDDNVGWRAGTEQICLSQARMDYLRGNAKTRVIPRFTGDANLLVGSLNAPAELHWVARKQPHKLTQESVWHLYVAPDATVLQRPWDKMKDLLGPMRALVNPYPAYPTGHYKNCCCGDYDLFAVWPLKKNYSPLDEDRRIAGMNSKAEDRDKQIEAWEDKKLGNISNRVHLVAQLINSALPSVMGAVGGRRDMCHHSDEAGRPGVTSLDTPIIAFIPIHKRVRVVTARTIQDVRTLVVACNELGFQVIINAGWKAQLGVVANFATTGDSRGWQTPQGDPARAR